MTDHNCPVFIIMMDDCLDVIPQLIDMIFVHTFRLATFVAAAADRTPPLCIRRQRVQQSMPPAIPEFREAVQQHNQLACFIAGNLDVELKSIQLYILRFKSEHRHLPFVGLYPYGNNEIFVNDHMLYTFVYLTERYKIDLNTLLKGFYL